MEVDLMIIEDTRLTALKTKHLRLSSVLMFLLQTGGGPICGNEFSSKGFFFSDFCLWLTRNALWICLSVFCSLALKKSHIN